MNNLIFPPADAKPAEIANALFVAMQQHQNYHQAAINAVRVLHPLDLHTLEYLRAAFSALMQEASNDRQGVDHRAGAMSAYARIDEYLATAILVAQTTDQ